MGARAGWEEEARRLRAADVKVTTISVQLGISRYRILCATDPNFGARHAERVQRNRIGNQARSYQAERPAIVPTERSVVKELWDGTRISLPRVAWLERPMPRVGS